MLVLSLVLEFVLDVFEECWIALGFQPERFGEFDANGRRHLKPCLKIHLQTCSSSQNISLCTNPANICSQS